MRKAALLCACSFLLSVNVYAKEFELVCPDSGSINAVKSRYDEFWRRYDYDAMSGGESLRMEGRGGSAKLGAFSFATWTDFLFLCWYHSDTGEQVLFTLRDFLEEEVNCHFPQTPDRSPIDCTSPDRHVCTLLCDS